MEYKKEAGVDLQIDKLLVVIINLLFFSPIIFIIIQDSKQVGGENEWI